MNNKPNIKDDGKEKEKNTNYLYPPILEYEHWDDDIVRSRFCYTVEDLLRNISFFEANKKWFMIDESCGYTPLLYNGKRCIFETPFSNCLFGLVGYKNPDSDLQKYSLNFSVRTDGRKDMEDLVLLVNKLENIAKIRQPDKNHVFTSTIKTERWNRSPTLRIKVPNFKRQLNIRIELLPQQKQTLEILYPSLDEFNHYITFSTKVSCQLLINNIWKAGYRYGISFKLLKLRIVEDPEDLLFR